MIKGKFPALAVAVALALAGATAYGEGNGEGDPVKGEKIFKKCSICHTIEPDKKKPLGPNLLGVTGRQAGTADFKYSDAMIAAGEKGLVWGQENIAEYVADPRAFLREYLDDEKARTKMSFKLRKEQDRKDVAAYLESLSKDPESLSEE